MAGDGEARSGVVLVQATTNSDVLGEPRRLCCGGCFQKVCINRYKGM